MPKVYCFLVDDRGGCGRHEPPLKGVRPAGSRGVDAWGKPWQAADKGKPMQTQPACQCASRQKRSVATTAVPSVARAPYRGRAEWRERHRPREGARKGQRQRERQAAIDATRADGAEKHDQPQDDDVSNGDNGTATTAARVIKHTGERGGGNDKRQPRTRRRGKGGPTPSRGRRTLQWRVRRGERQAVADKRCGRGAQRPATY